MRSINRTNLLRKYARTATVTIYPVDNRLCLVWLVDLYISTAQTKSVVINHPLGRGWINFMVGYHFHRG